MRLTGKEKVSNKRQLCKGCAVAYPGWHGWIDDPKDADVIWLLATGKCATTTTSHLINLSDSALAFHEIAPTLWSLESHVWKAGAEAGWESLLWAVKRDVVSIVNRKFGMAYAEMNHRQGMFAPAVERMTGGRARYVFLLRDLDSYVVSAYRWGHYMVSGGNQLGRLYNPRYESRRHQIAWAWCELNRYYLDFLKTIPPERKVFLPFEAVKDQDISRVQSIYEPLGLEAPDGEEIHEVLSAKTNAAKRNTVVEKNWHEFDEEAERIMDRARREFTGVATP